MNAWDKSGKDYKYERILSKKSYKGAIAGKNTTITVVVPLKEVLTTKGKRYKKWAGTVN
jgi:hypothetical protein